MNGSGVVRRTMAVAGALLAAATLVACRPQPLGSAGAQIGNDVANCAQYQPAPQAPCGPQPMVWAAIQGPYEVFANGDPYTTKCGRNLTASSSDCSSGPYAGGATNELYDPTGYEYAIDVGPGDVGVPLALEVYDAGTYPRSTGSVTTKSATVTTTVGSATLNRTGGTSFSASDVGKPISGAGIPEGSVVVTFVSTARVTISAPATAAATGVSVSITTTPDCNTGAAPFVASPYFGSVGTQSCQTGDSGTAPFQAQVFDDDGDDLAVGYDAPIAGCELFVAPGAQRELYKNAWAPVCTFVPGRAGVYPVRVKSSAITRPSGAAVADQGSGYNGFALRVGGGADTHLYALDVLSIWTNTPTSVSSVYLTEVTSAQAGQRLVIDLFDPGDGNSGQYSLQVLGPPSGAPGLVPAGGTVVPAAGIADSCRYNPTPSATRGPDVTAPSGAAAATCSVTTKYSGSSSGHYNNNWLRIQVEIADDYACESDCWWTVRYDFGSASTAIPTDRTTWRVAVVDPDGVGSPAAGAVGPAADGSTAVPAGA